MKTELKGKAYRLKGGKKPPAFILQSAHKDNSELLYFDNDQGVNRPLRYSKSQKTPFMDEQDNQARVTPITFIDGMLFVPKEDQVLQRFLSLHPGFNKIFEEIDKEKDAELEFENELVLADAIVAIKEMEVDRLAVMYRGLLGRDPSTKSAAEMRWDLTAAAKKDPDEFLNSIQDPEMEHRSNVVSFFTNGLLGFRKNRSEVFYNLKNNKSRMLVVPHGVRDPYEVVANFLKSDEGIEMLKILETENKV